MNAWLEVINIVILLVTAILLYLNLLESKNIRKISIVKEAYDKFIKIQDDCDRIIRNEHEIRQSKDKIEELRLTGKADRKLLDPTQKGLSPKTDEALSEVANCYEHIGLLLEQKILSADKFFNNNGFANKIKEIDRIASYHIENKYYWKHLVETAQNFR